MDNLASYTAPLKWCRICLVLLTLFSLNACVTATLTPQQQTSPAIQVPSLSRQPTTTPLPQLTPTSVLTVLAGSGHLAFASDRDGNTDIYTILADGSELTRITNSAEREFSLSASPDGKRIVFVYLDGKDDIYTISSDGSGFLRLTDTIARDTFPSWSPDGTEIIFSSNRDPVPDHEGPPPEIYLMADNGSDQTRVTRNTTSDTCPALSPDGQEIITSSFHYDYETSRIDVVNRDGSAQRMLVDTPAYDLCPVWSPDGTRIAFSSYTENLTTNSTSVQIWIMNSDGGNLTMLLDENAALISRVSWSPDSRWLAFSCIKNDNQDVFVVNIENHDVFNLTAESLAGEWDPTWLP